jgi:hypothetical protein
MPYPQPSICQFPANGVEQVVGTVVVVVLAGVVVVVALGAVVVVIVLVVVVVGAAGGSGMGQIVSGPNRRHFPTSFSRQRLYFARRKRPHAFTICGAHVERHSALEATSVASARPLATAAARMVIVAKRFTVPVPICSAPDSGAPVKVDAATPMRHRVGADTRREVGVLSPRV